MILIAILAYLLIQSAGVFSSSSSSLIPTSNIEDEELEGCCSPSNNNDSGSDVCSICLQDFNVQTLTLTCCNIKYCKKCIVKWLETSVNKCPICREYVPNLCFTCYSNIYEDGKKYVTTCCNKAFCYNCFFKINKENFLNGSCPFCNMYKTKGKLFDIIKLNSLCKECKTNIGKYSYSSFCPHEFCKECFDQITKENDNCPYCNQPLIKRKSNQCCCCFEAISDKTDTYKKCNSIFCKSCILSSMNIKGNTTCLYCSKDVITTVCFLCKSIIPEHKINITDCCRRRLCDSCTNRLVTILDCPCCHYPHTIGSWVKTTSLKKNR
ncbi:uncharacterized protein LOC126898730 [Daktulosphaira vitifoliae]|uniref:uncharacterized protein LOC126898730 n=1 Tax=Daktulosphaira vitifoliae TaxID=58002 RepID=UPI0021A97959|nr:uncharacterized protein LOC126898730 [Daktulosphaira vitifoliae]